MPKHLARIGAGCFAECPRLRLVEIPAYVETLQAGTFLEDRKLQEVRFATGSRLAAIGEDAFAECMELKQICLPDSVTRIGDRAFRRCKSLAEIHFPARLTHIGEEAFYFCAAKELHLPAKVVSVGSRAFCKWMHLEQVTLPESVQYLGDGAFRGCNRLKVLEIRHDPEHIGELIANRNTVIRCRKDSKVEEYCKEYGYQVEIVT